MPIVFAYYSQALPLAHGQVWSVVHVDVTLPIIKSCSTRRRTLPRLHSARQMVTQALPIKCLEAAVLAMYLTAPIRELTRFTLIFHSAAADEGSSSGDSVYKHIVLGRWK